MSQPFPDRTVEAVGACTRALAGLEYAEAAIAQSDAATLSGLRAFGDRLAIRARFHDADLYSRQRPAEPPGRDLFDALEHARLDALGASWLTGIARNILAHPGSEPETARWLAFETFSHLAAPEKRSPVESLRRSLPALLLAQLAGLSTLLKDQRRFGEAAVLWIRAAAPHIPRDHAPSPGPLPFDLRRKTLQRTLPRRGDPGATSAPLKGDPGAPTIPKRQPVPALSCKAAPPAPGIALTPPNTIASSTPPHSRPARNWPICI